VRYARGECGNSSVDVHLVDEVMRGAFDFTGSVDVASRANWIDSWIEAPCSPSPRFAPSWLLRS